MSLTFSGKGKLSFAISFENRVWLSSGNKVLVYDSVAMVRSSCGIGVGVTFSELCGYTTRS